MAPRPNIPHFTDTTPTAELRDLQATLLRRYHDIRVLSGRWAAAVIYALSVPHTRAAQILGANTDPSTRYRVVAGIEWDESVRSMYDVQYFDGSAKRWSSALAMIGGDKATTAVHSRIRHHIEDAFPAVEILLHIDTIMANRMLARPR